MSNPHSAAPAATELRAATRSAMALARQLTRAIDELEQEAAVTPDFAGVRRLGPRALVVRSDVLRTRGGGRLTMNAVDAPGQVRQVAAIVGSLRVAPATAAKQLSAILRSGKCRLGDGDFVPDPQIVTRFKAELTAAVRLAKVIETLQATPV